MTLEQLRADFVAALAAHDCKAKLPSTGPYHFRPENERIGALVHIIDPFLMESGVWPADRRYIGNDKRLELLDLLIVRAGSA